MIEGIKSNNGKKKDEDVERKKVDAYKSSFIYKEVKYFVPFYKNEEFWIKPKYFQEQRKGYDDDDGNRRDKTHDKTLLDMLTNMFPRKMLGIETHEGEDKKRNNNNGNNHRSESYWRNIIEVEKRVSLLLIFNDKTYQQYGMEKPTSTSKKNNSSSKHRSDNNDGFRTIDKADTLLPQDLYPLFLPPTACALVKPSTSNVDHPIRLVDIAKNMRLKLRISSQHIHPRSIVIPYEPSIIYQDNDIVAVHKPFGIPSVSDIHDLGNSHNNNNKNSINGKSKNDNDNNTNNKEWNSILLWARQNIHTSNHCSSLGSTSFIENNNYSNSDKSSQKSNNIQKRKSNKRKNKSMYGESSQLCDLMNRLDVDVSGVILLGLSGKYRKKRGFQSKTTKQLPLSESNNFIDSSTIFRPCNVKKIYLAIVPKQLQATRITTPPLTFDKRQSRAVILTTTTTTTDNNNNHNNNNNRENGDSAADNSRKCRTSLYPLLQLDDGQHTLVAICLEESGQRHQIRYHLSLINATIPNDDLYRPSYSNEKGGTIIRRTGVSSTTTAFLSNNKRTLKSSNDAIQHEVETLSNIECERFLQAYVYNINGVVGFQQQKEDQGNSNRKISPHHSTLQKKLIQRPLYPRWECKFEKKLKDHFFPSSNSIDAHPNCGKCRILQTELAPNLEINHESNINEMNKDVVILKHGIYLHSWRYFNPTDKHSLFEADLPSSSWWPVKIIRNTESNENSYN